MTKSAPAGWKTTGFVPGTQVVHSYFDFDGDPPYVPHNVAGDECWCRPRILIPCYACSHHDPNPSCRLCLGEGWIERSGDGERTKIVAHRHTRGVVDHMP